MFNRYLVMAMSIVAQFPLANSLSAQGSGIEEIRITADPLSSVDDHLIQPTQILGKKDLNKRSIQNIGETVSHELGVSSSDFGAGVGRPVIRGLGGGRVKVLESGISTMDASTVSNDHATTSEPVFAEQVEILRGPATLLYGSGASGGLVNVVTNRIPVRMPDGVEADALAQYESVNNAYTAAASVNAGESNLVLHLDGMKRDTEDYDIPGFAELEPAAGEEPGTVENSALETENVSAGLSFIGDTATFGMAVSGLNSNYGIPGHHHHEEEAVAPAVEEEGGVTIDLEQVRYDFLGSVKNPLSGLREIKTRWGYNDYEHAEIEPTGDIGTSIMNDELEGRVEFIHEPLGANNWNGVVGVHMNQRDFEAIGDEAFVPASEQDALALFLVEKADFGQWHVDLGARYENQQTDNVNDDSVEHDLVSVSGGLNYDYTEGYQIGASVGRSQRGASIEELFAFGPHAATNSFEVGSIDLVDETSTNIDLHWQHEGDSQTFMVNLFYNRINDYVYQLEQDLNGDGFADRVEPDFSGDPAEILDPANDEEPLLLFHTQDDARFLGFELETVFRLVDTDQNSLDLRLWTDYVDAELTDGSNLPRISPWRLGSSVDYESGPWVLNLDYTLTGKQDHTATLEDPTSGYHMLNAYAAYTFDSPDSALTVFVRATNLLDEEARRHTSFVKNIAPLAGRSGLLGLRVTF